MKKLITIFLSTVLAAGLACTGDDPVLVSARQLAFERLSGKWAFGTSGSILLDGEDISANYPGFTLSFADGSYQTQNGGDLFSATGSWEFLDEEARMIRLDSGEEITIINLTESEFEFSFLSDGNGGSAAGIGGNYLITLNK